MSYKLSQKELRQQIAYLIGTIKDPQKTHQTLQELQVVSQDNIFIQYFNKKLTNILNNNSQCEKSKDYQQSSQAQPLSNNKPKQKQQSQQHNSQYYTKIIIKLKPTNPHCHLIQQIALSIRYRLILQLQQYQSYKIKIYCLQNTHAQQHQINTLINDKQRIAAALENQHITLFLNQLLKWTN